MMAQTHHQQRAEEPTRNSCTSPPRPFRIYEAAWCALRSRGIHPIELGLVAVPAAGNSNVGQETTTTDSGLLACLTSFAGADDGGVGKEILEVIRSDTHASEEEFSRQLFGSVVRGFVRGGWNVSTCEGRRSRVSARRVARIPGVTRDDEGGDPVVLDDMVILGRRVADPKKPSPVTDENVDDDDDEGGATTTATTAGASGTVASNEYVVTVGDWTYAMGLCRKARAAPEGGDGGDDGDDESAPSIRRGDSYPDHAWAVYKKKRAGTGNQNNNDDVERRHGWIVHQIVAAVELTMDDTACQSFPVKESPPGAGTITVRRDCFNDANDLWYGPLGLELVYVAEHVLWGRAVLGLGLPEELPFAVVAGTRDRATMSSSSSSPPAPQPPNDALRGVHGYLFTPSECGGAFCFGVDAFGALDDPSSGSMALASYVSVMADGIRTAEAWLAALANQAKLPVPCPLSGRRLMFGSESLQDVPLWSSPVTRSDDQVNVFALATEPADPSWEGVKISQGELFRGKVNLSKLQQDAPKSRRVSWLVGPAEAKARADCEGNHSVIVKVSSMASFGQLVDLQGFIWNPVSNREHRSWDEVCRCLSSSLYGIYSTEYLSGLVQIMPDLLSEGFEPLRPESLKAINQWSCMWTAFEHFVQRTLIPLADAWVIHPDLRPGFNCTANLLYHQVKKEIRMVDLDSLVEFGRWGSLEPVDDRYVSVKRRRLYQRQVDAPMEFVLKQAVVIAEAWIQSVPDNSAHVDRLFAASEVGLEFNRDESLACDSAFIHRALAGYRAQFGAAGD